MDIQLKGSQLDGVKLCRLFRGTLQDPALPPYARECPTITAPIIFVTAYGQRYTEAELKGVGGHMLITKPVDFNRIPLRPTAPA
jgi:CheY-like chemotaxis protein